MIAPYCDECVVPMRSHEFRGLGGRERTVGGRGGEKSSCIHQGAYGCSRLPNAEWRFCSTKCARRAQFYRSCPRSIYHRMPRFSRNCNIPDETYSNDLTVCPQCRAHVNLEK